jgi:ADP-dependent NAD(P)H-hydrate dehydratase / NAD(P)H-hydrate epimerase
MVWIAGTETQISGDALKHLGNLHADGVTIEEFRDAGGLDLRHGRAPGADFLIDGLLGTGSHGAARGPVAAAIQYINSAANDAFVISIDIPSGINADTGIAEGDAVNADVTVTMGLPKTGLVAPAPRRNSSDAWRSPTSAFREPYQRSRAAGRSGNDLFPRASPVAPPAGPGLAQGNLRPPALIGGARDTRARSGLACRAAARSGVGLTTALTPASILPVVASASLETMVHAGAETSRRHAVGRRPDPWIPAVA